MAVSTVGSGKQFATLQAWVNAKGSSSAAQDAECYGNIGTGGLVMDTWNPSSSRIYAAIRHGLTLASASVTLTGVIDMANFTGSNIIIDGIRFIGGSAWQWFGTAAGTVSISVLNCIIEQTLEWTPTTDGATINWNVFNNVFFSNGSELHATDVGAGGPIMNALVHHNLWTGAAGSINFAEDGLATLNLTARNNMAEGYVSSISRGTKTCSNNISAADNSADTALGGSGNIINTSLASQLKNTASDWRLRDPVVVATAAGYDVRSSVSTDASGLRSRPSRPCIGPFEFGAVERKLGCLLID